MLHLLPGGIPSHAFWSVTLEEVEKEGQFLAANPINGYEISSTTPNLRAKPDGSIDIWIQSAAPPTDKVANWLPSPASGLPFLLFARSYEPKPEVLTGDFRMPAVHLLARQGP